MKRASPDSNYIWNFNDKDSNLLELTKHFYTELKICQTE